MSAATPLHRLAPVAALLLSACATHGSLPPAPLLKLDDRNCSSAPDLAAARPLPPVGSGPLTVTIERDAPCLVGRDGHRGTYVLFRLPESAERYIAAVGSQPSGLTLYSPRLAFLDAGGEPTHGVAREQFQFRGAGLNATSRVRPEDRYLLVQSEESSIGALQQRIQSTVSAASTSVGTFYSGDESSSTIQNAHNGTISVTLTELPKEARAAAP